MVTTTATKDAPEHDLKTPFRSLPLMNAGENVWLHEARENLQFHTPTGHIVELSKGVCFYTSGVDFSEVVGLDIQWADNTITRI